MFFKTCMIFVLIRRVMLTSLTKNYSFVMNGGRKVTFYLNELQRNEAENVCEQDSSNLLIVENADMQNFINDKMRNIPLKVSSTDYKYLNGWWTAGINNPNNGTWFWSTGNNSLKVFNGSSFNNWKGYSPLRYSSQNCMYLYPFNNLTYNFNSEDNTKTFYNSFGGWLNKPCNFKSYYICIKSLIQTKEHNHTTSNINYSTVKNIYTTSKINYSTAKNINTSFLLNSTTTLKKNRDESSIYIVTI